MKKFIFELAQKLWPELAEMSARRQLSGVGEVFSFLYSLPLAIIGLAWLAAVTDLRVLWNNWPLTLLLAILMLAFRKLHYFIISEIRSGRYGSSDGSLEIMTLWTGMLLFGPTIVWVSILLVAVDLVWGWRGLLSQYDRWNRLRNFTFYLASNTLASLLALAFYQSAGGLIPQPDLSFHFLLPAMGAFSIHFLIIVLIWAGYTVYLAWSQIEQAGKAGVLPLLRFLLLALGLPALAQPFAFLAAGLYSEHGIGSFLFFIAGMLLVALLTRQLSRAAETSRQTSRQLEKLEQFGRALLNAPPDASMLKVTLAECLAAMFPPGRLGIWLEKDGLLFIDPIDWSFDHKPVWEWLAANPGVTAFQGKERLPWAAGRMPHNPVVVSAILNVDDGQPQGGIYLELFSLSQTWDRTALEGFFPALQSLAAQVASALHQAEIYDQALSYQKISQELSLAGKIQSSFLPNELPRMDGWQLAVTLLPARETSGDYFDMIPLENQRLGIVIADVTDKGVGAALYMALSRTLIRTFALEFDDAEPQPELVFFSANDRILQDAHAELFVTAFYEIIDLANGQLTYCNAGHPSPYLMRGGESCTLEALVPTGMPLGIEEDNLWKRATTQINPGDVLVLYTDGIPDSLNEHGQFFEDQNLRATIASSLSLPAQDLQAAILERIHQFVGEAPQFDDITLMVLARDA